MKKFLGQTNSVEQLKKELEVFRLAFQSFFLKYRRLLVITKEICFFVMSNKNRPHMKARF